MKLCNHRQILLGLASVFALFGAILPRASAASPADDEQAFAQCAGCHSTKPGANGIGPSLADIVGHQSGQAPGYDYSAALKQAKLTWNKATLDKFLQNPQGLVPGTKMFVSVPDAQQRQDLIAYLQTLHQ
jgi:cytochrome c2